MANFELLKELTQAWGVAGREKAVRAIVLRELEGHVDSAYVDNIGNIIAVKHGKGSPDSKKIMLSAHMDEIGLPILGTPADAIDEAEDRERFDELLERCKIPRAPGRTVFNLDEALAAADEIGLPVSATGGVVPCGATAIWEE